MTNINWEIDIDGSHNLYELPHAIDTDEYTFGGYVDTCPTCGDIIAVIMMHATYAETGQDVAEETFHTVEQAKRWVEDWEPSVEQYQQAADYAAFMELVDDLVDE